MKLNKNHKILIVGPGLPGGSYAMALTKQGFHVSAIPRDQESDDREALREMMRFSTKRRALFDKKKD